MALKNNIIEMELPPEKYTITLENKFFDRSYAVYVLELIHNTNKFYYIGDLSDTQNLSNKYSFRRLSAHFDDTLSARGNNVFRHILNKILEPDLDPLKRIQDDQKNVVAKFLQESEVKMHVYPLLKFSYHESNKKKHRECIQKVKVFEAQLLRQFNLSSKRLINEDIPNTYVRYADIEFPKVWEQIKKDFYL